MFLGRVVTHCYLIRRAASAPGHHTHVGVNRADHARALQDDLHYAICKLYSTNSHRDAAEEATLTVRDGQKDPDLRKAHGQKSEIHNNEGRKQTRQGAAKGCVCVSGTEKEQKINGK